MKRSIDNTTTNIKNVRNLGKIKKQIATKKYSIWKSGRCMKMNKLANDIAILGTNPIAITDMIPFKVLCIAPLSEYLNNYFVILRIFSM
ncbi:MAG: hypothetical protein COA79_00005 [Planctomycetota bacterium]|nr:MAG: hypothetical protein COA79_00005 [Planctomycetota bacterium]